MRADIIKVYKDLHTWTGLIAGMALFIAFYAGSLTMFEQQLNQWATAPQNNHQQYQVNLDKLPELMQQTLAAHPSASKELTLYLKPKENAPASLSWKEEIEGVEPSHYFIRESYFWSGLDESGQLVSAPYRPSEMANLIDLLHQTAGIPGEDHHLFGVYVMGVISILYVLAIVSGLVIFLPVIAKDLFALRLGKNIKRFWQDAHNAVGFISIPFHLVIAFSVVVFAFHDFIYSGLDALVYPDKAQPEKVQETDFKPDFNQLAAPQLILDRLNQIDPDFVVQEMVYRNLEEENASIWIAGVSDGHIMRASARGIAFANPYSGEITDTTYMPGQNDSWANIVISFFALHFGNFGGDFVRWLYFFMGLAGAFLFYSGNLLWLEARRRRQRRGQLAVSQKRNTELMAALTVGVCWGSVAGVACAMLLGRWLGSSIDNLTPWYISCYYLVFFASVGWAFYAGAARALVHLLGFCALACLAISFTGVIAFFFPQSAPWIYLRAELLAIELGALITGLAFVYACVKSAKRVYQGAPDSVWAATPPSRFLPSF